MPRPKPPATGQAIGGKDYGTFLATAYGPPWGGIEGGGQTATGMVLPPAETGHVGPPYIIAVDPSVIPLGTKVNISPNPTGDNSIVWDAQDTGGAIKGKRIDILMLNGHAAANAWGMRPVHVTSAGSQSGTTPGIARPGGSSDSGAQIDALFANYDAEVNMPRTAPKGEQSSLKWWLKSFGGRFGKE